MTPETADTPPCGAGLTLGEIANDRARAATHGRQPIRLATHANVDKRADGILYVKGAFEVLLPRCSAGTEGANDANAEMAGRGLRVIAVAIGAGAEEEELRLLVGLVPVSAIELTKLLRRARTRAVQ